MKIYFTHASVGALAAKLAKQINLYAAELGASRPAGQRLAAYAVQHTGVAVAYLLGPMVPGMLLVETPDEADIFIDDIILSGATCEALCDAHPGKPFFALLDKRDANGDYDGHTIVFPWAPTKDDAIQDHIVQLLEYVGEDSNREGLQETPARVAKAWKHWCGGYGKNAKDILKVFEDGAENYDQMVIVKDIPIYSHCEHHLAPIFGTVSIAYIPNGKIAGLSKLSRLADMFARRLQVQERLTDQIADALMEHLQPLGVGVIIKARHLCMESRGICQQGHHTVTTSLRGVIKSEAQTRAEFLRLAN